MNAVMGARDDVQIGALLAGISHQPQRGRAIIKGDDQHRRVVQPGGV